MRQQLAALGFSVPFEPLSDNQDSFAVHGAEDPIAQYSDQVHESPTRGISSRTAGRSAYTNNSGDATTPESQLRPLKRQRIDSPLPENIHAPPKSRDLMPPPKKPLSRMKSMRRFLPTRRKRHANNRSSPAFDTDRTGRDVQMDDRRQEDWSEHYNGNGNSQRYNRPLARDDIREETPYMTGGLPIGYSPHRSESSLPQMNPDVGVRSEPPEFTFRAASPVKGTVNHNHSLPTQPSYIQLMDGISRDSGLELELRDPRRSTHNHGRSLYQHGQTQDFSLGPTHRGYANAAKSWDLEREFMHQSPNGAPPGAYKHPDPLRSNPPDGAMSHMRNDAITPAPQRFHQPTSRAESVVSPFFRNSDYDVQVFSRSGVAEREDSSLRSDAFHFQRPKAIAQADWSEPRSLNGLSFFDSPRNARNEPIGHGLESLAYRECPQQYRSHHSLNLNSQGLITRPITGRSPFIKSTFYSSHDLPSCHQQPQLFVQNPARLRSPNRPSRSRAPLQSSSVPSAVSAQGSPVRYGRSDRNSLESTGFRSSRPVARHVPGNEFVTPSKDIFPSSGRRIVRR